MKKDNIILLILGSPFLLGIFYFVFGIGLVTSLILSLGITGSSTFLLDGLAILELQKLTIHGVNKIKKDIFKIQEELEVNKEYLQEVENFFKAGRINKENTTKVTDILTFKSLFQNTDIEQDIYQIKNNINSLFTLFNDRFVKTESIEKKKDIVEKIREMNESKSELFRLLEKTKKNTIDLMNKNIESILEVRDILVKNKDELGDKAPPYYKHNIDSLDSAVRNLEIKIDSLKNRKDEF